MIICGIYKIISIIKPERFYIGSANDIIKRFDVHKSNLRKNKHHSPKLQRHYNKYGKDDLEFLIIDRFDFISKEHLLSREQYYLDTLRPYFNINKIANSALGIKRSKKTCHRISKGNKGKIRTEEQNQANRERNIGKKLSEEHIKKIKEKTKGHVVTQETRHKISIANTGKVRTEEVRKKYSEAKKGKKPKNPEQARINRSNAAILRWEKEKLNNIENAEKRIA